MEQRRRLSNTVGIRPKRRYRFMFALAALGLVGAVLAHGARALVLLVRRARR
jgi:hypothetical protein